jgi:hypothetical protein
VARVAADLGVDPVATAGAIGKGSGASRALEIVGGDVGRLAGLRPFLDKDVDALLAVVSELGIELGLLEPADSTGNARFGSS